MKFYYKIYTFWTKFTKTTTLKINIFLCFNIFGGGGIEHEGNLPNIKVKYISSHWLDKKIYIRPKRETFNNISVSFHDKNFVSVTN